MLPRGIEEVLSTKEQPAAAAAQGMQLVLERSQSNYRRIETDDSHSDKLARLIGNHDTGPRRSRLLCRTALRSLVEASFACIYS